MSLITTKCCHQKHYRINPLVKTPETISLNSDVRVTSSFRRSERREYKLFEFLSQACEFTIGIPLIVKQKRSALFPYSLFSHEGIHATATRAPNKRTWHVLILPPPVAIAIEIPKKRMCQFLPRRGLSASKRRGVDNISAFLRRGWFLRVALVSQRLQHWRRRNRVRPTRPSFVLALRQVRRPGEGGG